MKFTELALPGVYLIEFEPIRDERGFFARTWCRKEFISRGLNADLAQCSLSFSAYKGTLRGMHYQFKPHEEAKLVCCVKGAIYDVILDLREQSPTFKQWISVELTAEDYEMLYVPEGFAHGFQTLKNCTEVFYQISQCYHPESARGIRWNDPVFKIDWKLKNPILSDKDSAFPSFK